MKREETELIAVSSKGQVVIPQTIRSKLDLRPKTKLLVYGKKDTIILKKIKIPSLEDEWKKIFNMFKRKKLKLTQKEIQREIKAYRKEKRLKKKNE